ncbi:unnamed protein product [Chrysoparadoxa australica]
MPAERGSGSVRAGDLDDLQWAYDYELPVCNLDLDMLEDSLSMTHRIDARGGSSITGGQFDQSSEAALLREVEQAVKDVNDLDLESTKATASPPLAAAPSQQDQPGSRCIEQIKADIKAAAEKDPAIDVHSMLKPFDVSRGGLLSYRELRSAVRGLKLDQDLNDKEALELAHAADRDGSGLVGTGAFEEMIREADPSCTSPRRDSHSSSRGNSLSSSRGKPAGKPAAASRRRSSSSGSTVVSFESWRAQRSSRKGSLEGRASDEQAGRRFASRPKNTCGKDYGWGDGESTLQKQPKAKKEVIMLGPSPTLRRLVLAQSAMGRSTTEESRTPSGLAAEGTASEELGCEEETARVAEAHVRQKVGASTMTFRRALQKVDASSSQVLTATEFDKALSRYGIDLEPAERTCLAAKYADDKGLVHFEDLVESLEKETVKRGTNGCAGPDNDLAESVVARRVCKKALSALESKGFGSTQAVFRLVDKDQTGSLDAEGLKNGLSLLGCPPLSSIEFNTFFRIADKDGSGAVDYAELVEMVQRKDAQFENEYIERKQARENKIGGRWAKHLKSSDVLGAPITTLPGEGRMTREGKKEGLVFARLKESIADSERITGHGGALLEAFDAEGGEVDESGMQRVLGRLGVSIGPGDLQKVIAKGKRQSSGWGRASKACMPGHGVSYAEFCQSMGLEQVEREDFRVSARDGSTRRYFKDCHTEDCGIFYKDLGSSANETFRTTMSKEVAGSIGTRPDVTGGETKGKKVTKTSLREMLAGSHQVAAVMAWQENVEKGQAEGSHGKARRAIMHRPVDTDIGIGSKTFLEATARRVETSPASSRPRGSSASPSKCRADRAATSSGRSLGSTYGSYAGSSIAHALEPDLHKESGGRRPLKKRPDSMTRVIQPPYATTGDLAVARPPAAIHATQPGAHSSMRSQAPGSASTVPRALIINQLDQAIEGKCTSSAAGGSGRRARSKSLSKFLSAASSPVSVRTCPLSPFGGSTCGGMTPSHNKRGTFFNSSQLQLL